MSDKGFLIVIAAIIVGVGGYIGIHNANKPKEVIIGIEHANQGQLHVAKDQKHETYNSEPASSGPHRNDSEAPALWGVYTTELTPEVYIHNEEHGGVVITYKPDLPADQLAKLQNLFAPPYSNKTFSPTKFIVMPRAANTHPIELAAWTYTLNMDTYSEANLIKFYLQHQGKSPEAGAGPNNTPINEAKLIRQ